MTLYLVARSGERLVALPLASVSETMRPLAFSAIAGAPPFVKGLSLIRGTPTAVVDLGRLIGGESSERTTRFVTVVTGERSVALAVDAVLGIRDLPVGALGAAPPLLRDAAMDALEAVGRLDAELLVVLRASRLLVDRAWYGAGAVS